VLPGLNTGSWVWATACGAMLAHAVGISPSLLLPQPAPVLNVLGALAGTVLLASISARQWLVLGYRG
jgi:hypothetical protein